jgi:hypothetical protein
MLTQSQFGCLKPGEIAGLLRLAVDKEARPKDRVWARAQLFNARQRISYDDLGLAVKKIAAKNSRLHATLKEFVLEIFSAS